ncbi:MAG: hypothetical protein FWE01_01060 [Firmicutes bacterium]|nr:hypothetical protein [Bacillota bacterium]
MTSPITYNGQVVENLYLFEKPCFKIVVGLPGTGKTSYITGKLSQAMFDHDLHEETCDQVQLKIEGGFNLTKPYEHSVCANFHLVAEEWGYSPRKAWNVELERLAVKDGTHIATCKKTGRKIQLIDPQFIPPGSILGLQEAGEALDSHNWKNLLPCQKKFFKRYRHYRLRILMDTQEYGDIAYRIRVLAGVIEIQTVEFIKSKSGYSIHTKWTNRHFANGSEYEKYLASGKTTKNYITEIYIIPFDIRNNYDSYGCEPDFIQGNLNQDYELKHIYPPAHTRQAYMDYYNEKDLNSKEYFYD